MPAMGDSVAEGTVLEWHKQEGDTVAADETLVEISTDKVDAEVPSPASGTIVKIHAAEGDTVAVGAVLAEISANGGSVDEAMPVSGESPPATPEEATGKFDQWAERDVDLQTGPVKGKYAAIETALPIAAVAFGMTAFALVLHFSV